MITKRQISYLTVVFIYVVLFGCSKRQAEEIVPQVTPPVTTPKNVTFTNFTKGLIESKCSSCHNVGRSAAAIWTYNGLSSIISNESRIRRVVLVNRSMPMGGSLTADELKSLQEWFDNKMPE